MKILHLEDNPLDAELIHAKLREEWPDCELVLVKDRPEFVRHLQQGEFDLVLSDFNLNDFNGLDALKISRQQAPDTPFIFLSGTIGEDRAIAALRAGAHDYVLKDRIKQLAPAIHRAMRDQEDARRRQEAEDAQRRFVAILENTPDLVALIAVSGTFFYMNDAGRRMLKLRPEDDIGRFSLRDFLPAQDTSFLQDRSLPQAEKEGVWTGEAELVPRGGGRIPVSQAIIAHHSADRSVEYFSTIARNISDIREAENQIRTQANLLNQANDAIVVSDRDGVITFWNRGAEAIFGWTSGEAVGRERASLFNESGSRHPSGLPEQDWQGEVIVRNKSGDARTINRRVTVIRDSAGAFNGHLAISTDVTELKKLEEQFLRAQRLESIGMLASGIAHDLNNVLAPILMAAPMLRENTTHPRDLNIISTLEKSAERGAGLVRQILGFVHGISGERETLQIKHLLRDISDVIKGTFPKNIRLKVEMESEPWIIEAQTTQVHQIILNLCVNARDAMPDGGTLAIRIRNLRLNESSARQYDVGQPGPYLLIEVEDTGTGMPPEVLERIWEPFFTTKPRSRGTGLGLATVRGIIRNHNGLLAVDSAPGKGTTFQILFPATVGTVKSGDSSPGLDLPAGSGERILVVDDEASVCEMCSNILSSHGYRALISENAADALAQYVPQMTEIDAVIVDLKMPEIDGLALVEVLRRLDPSVRILLMSGMDQKFTSDRHNLPFLAKPFSAKAILKAVHEMLGVAPDDPPGSS